MWTYDLTNLNTTSAGGRLNAVRLLVGDTDESEQLVQDEEIQLALSQAGDNIYYTASWICRVLAAKFARMVDTQLDGALEQKYSDRIKHYTLLSSQMSELGKKTSGKSLGVSAGGISKTQMDLANADTDRVGPKFSMDQFSIDSGAGYIPDYD